VAGSVVGAIVVGAIVAFGWYKIRTLRNSHQSPAFVAEQGGEGQPQQAKRMVIGDSEMTPMEQVGDSQMPVDPIASANLRYLED
jgi:hypothetical protein